jgi:hypothetical protein
MTAVVAAIILSAIFATMAGVGSVLAASGEVVGPWVSGGGSFAAVGGLAYLAKKFANGELVAANTGLLIQQGAAREERLLRLEDDAHDREDALRALLLAQRGDR